MLDVIYSHFDPQRSCTIENGQIRSIIYGLLAHALDRRPAVPSRSQTIVRLRESFDRLSRAILPLDENARHVEIGDSKAISRQIIAPD